MILEFGIKNFLSFNKEVKISFEATKNKSFEDYHVVEVAPGIRILKLGIVYGANASGKSNFINAFEFLHDFWRNTPENKDEEIDIIPFLLNKSSRNKPTEFNLVFYVGRIKHRYSVRLTDKHIISESLHYYPGAQPAELFSRSFVDGISKISFGSKLKVKAVTKDEISVKCLPNMSVLSAYNKVNDIIQEIENVSYWIKNQYMASVEPELNLVRYTENVLMKDSSIKDYILEFLNEADYNIENIQTKFQNKKVSQKIITALAASDIPEEELKKLQREKTIKVTETVFTHNIINKKGEEILFELPDKLQSKGTLRTMGLAGVIHNAVKRNAFLAIDEIESSLHPTLVDFIIESFLVQSETSQLLLTTHNDSLLEEDDLLRNDNIWFTNKKLDGSTEIYSLSDFKGLSRISSLQKAYKFGKFGAVPNI